MKALARPVAATTAPLITAILATAWLPVLPALADPPASTTPADVPAPPARAHMSKPHLDLTAPDLARLYPRAQLSYVLNQSDADADVLDAPAVSVQGEHYVAVPLGQLQAIPWAILHPTQFWRIFTPVVAP